MTSPSIPRPAADEAAPFYHRYIARVSGENIGEQLIDQLAEMERLFGALDDTVALARYLPGKWSIKEVLGHLTDVERIFSYRLLCISRGDVTPLPGFEEKAYVPVAEFDERPLRDSARALAYIIVGHVTHHHGVLRERYGLGSGAATAFSAENR